MIPRGELPTRVRAANQHPASPECGLIILWQTVVDQNQLSFDFRELNPEQVVHIRDGIRVLVRSVTGQNRSDPHRETGYLMLQLGRVVKQRAGALSTP